METRKKIKAGLAMASLPAILLALGTSTAHATVTDWGVHDPVEIGTGIESAGSFLDIYSFTLPTANGLASTAVANDLYINSTSQLHISDGTVQLFQGTYGDATPDTLKLSYSFNGTTGDTSHSLTGLTSSAPYYYEVTGLADGAHGGVYSLTSTFSSPVPEPETYGMLMAGLGLMGVIARRRRNKS